MVLTDIINDISTRFKLTQAEKHQLKYILLGYENEAIAREMFLSVKTVKNHVSNITKKTNMGRKQLQAAALLLCCEDRKDFERAYPMTFDDSEYDVVVQ